MSRLFWYERKDFKWDFSFEDEVRIFNTKGCVCACKECMPTNTQFWDNKPRLTGVPYSRERNAWVKIDDLNGYTRVSLCPYRRLYDRKNNWK